MNEQWPEGVSPIAYADYLVIIVEKDRRKEFAGKAQRGLDMIQAWAHENKLKASSKKTVCMINTSSPRQRHRDIRLTVDDKRVELVFQCKYLGFIIDPKLNFELNAAYATTRVKRLAMALQTTEAAIRNIYRGALLLILKYGSRVWIDRLQLSKIKRKYNSIYGTMARVISQNNSTVSRDAAGVIAGILPTDLELERFHCLSERRRRRTL